MFVQESDASLEFRKKGVVAADMDGGGHAEIFLNDFHEIAVEVPVFDAIVVAIANQEEGFASASVQADAVAGLEFSFGFTGTAESFYKFAIFIEFEDVI